MSKDSSTQQKATRQHPPTKIIVERHYVGTEKMETVFKRIAEEQITKKVKEIAENNANQHWKRKRELIFERSAKKPGCKTQSGASEI